LLHHHHQILLLAQLDLKVLELLGFLLLLHQFLHHSHLDLVVILGSHLAQPIHLLVHRMIIRHYQNHLGHLLQYPLKHKLLHQGHRLCNFQGILDSLRE